MTGTDGGPEVSCQAFDEAVDELAIGTLVDPERTALLSHAASCPACEAHLNELAGVADRLLLLAPEAEPPAGFEAAVLSRMGVSARVPDTGAAPATRRARPWGWPMALAAAAAAVVLIVAGVALGRATRHSPAAAGVRSGAIVTSTGDHIGGATVSSRPAPSVLLTMYEAPGSGPFDCELVTRQGQAVVVGSWDYGQLHGGAWATGIDRSLTGAVAMRLLDGQGRVVATATLR